MEQPSGAFPPPGTILPDLKGNGFRVAAGDGHLLGTPAGGPAPGPGSPSTRQLDTNALATYNPADCHIWLWTHHKYQGWVGVPLSPDAWEALVNYAERSLKEHS